MIRNKFKAWHIKEKKWIIDRFFMENKGNCIIARIGQTKAGADINKHFSIGRDVELMQYAWLKDKNKKEIYNGDVVKNKKGETETVSWLENTSGFYPFASEIQSIREDFRSRNCEVIGNKYENPELLDLT